MARAATLGIWGNTDKDTHPHAKPAAPGRMRQISARFGVWPRLQLKRHPLFLFSKPSFPAGAKNQWAFLNPLRVFHPTEIRVLVLLLTAENPANHNLPSQRSVQRQLGPESRYRRPGSRFRKGFWITVALI